MSVLLIRIECVINKWADGKAQTYYTHSLLFTYITYITLLPFWGSVVFFPYLLSLIFKVVIQMAIYPKCGGGKKSGSKKGGKKKGGKKPC